MKREREFKFDLGDEDGARRLEALLGNAAAAVGACLQVNRFFDTPDRALQRWRWALRLRAEWDCPLDAPLPPEGAPTPGPPARVILGLKGARTGTGAFHDRPEEQFALPVTAWRLGSLPLGKLLPTWRARLPLGGAPLVERVRFVNLRRTWPLASAWRAEIDRTRFGDGRRAWEIEMEIGGDDDPAAAQATLAALAARGDVTLKPQPKSKLQRAQEQD